ncbi:MAG: HlyC/CorC family transporter [Desulfobacteraceae bacterium]|nr:HlyC/CorC family transporter [Desulfobacteraceae bacterium]
MILTSGTAIAAGLPNTGSSTASGHTNTDVILLVSYILLALVFSFLCSVAEAVLLSITPSYIAGLGDNKPKLAALLKRLKQDKVDQSLAAILTLNTIAHTVGAIGAGAKATLVFGSAWFGLFSAIMTLMILFLSEIIPKTIGAMYWRTLAGLTAHFVRILIWSLFPLIWISEALTRLIARGKSAHVFSRDEFVAMAGIGERSGQIDEQESHIIRNLFRFGSLTAGDVMTPRTVIVAFPQDVTVTDALETRHKAPFSRLPLYGTDIDHITGFILRDDLLLSKAQDRGGDTLESLKRDILTVPDKMKLSDLLTVLLDDRQHVALVVGEFGGTKGLVTLEDVVETLLGLEIVDEMDKVEDMQVLARRQWAKRARAMGLEVSADGQIPER